MAHNHPLVALASVVSPDRLEAMERVNMRGFEKDHADFYLKCRRLYFFKDPELKTLVRNCDDAAVLGDALLSNSELQELHLNLVADAASKELLQATTRLIHFVEVSPNLRHLYLGIANSEKVMIENVDEACKTIVEFATKLMQAAGRNAGIKVVSLRNCYISSKTLLALSNKAGLTGLHLEHCRMADADPTQQATVSQQLHRFEKSRTLQAFSLVRSFNTSTQHLLMRHFQAHCRLNSLTLSMRNVSLANEVALVIQHQRRTSSKPTLYTFTHSNFTTEICLVLGRGFSRAKSPFSVCFGDNCHWPPLQEAAITVQLSLLGSLASSVSLQQLRLERGSGVASFLQGYCATFGRQREKIQRVIRDASSQTKSKDLWAVTMPLCGTEKSGVVRDWLMGVVKREIEGKWLTPYGFQSDGILAAAVGEQGEPVSKRRRVSKKQQTAI